MKTLFLAFIVLFVSSQAALTKKHPMATSCDSDDKLDCILQIVSQMQSVEPAPEVSFQAWPGNTICVSCYVFGGSIVAAIEIVALHYGMNFMTELVSNTNGFSSLQAPRLSNVHNIAEGSSWMGLVGVLLSGAGWLYWSTIFLTFWNFVSWMMLIGLIGVSPPLVYTYLETRTQYPFTTNYLLKKRLKLTGWLLGILCLGMFPNVTVMPSQVYRHLRASDVIVVPNDPSVLQLRDQFFQTVPEEQFYGMGFQDQMLAVDFFIFDTIIWKTDYEQYKVVGLLTTPNEVVTRMAGDCQGQAAVTASLLISLGFEAWVVETPFHWWTHARNNVTGQSYNLNSHGHGGPYGNVVPQPIDLVFTHPQEACTDCPYIFSHNQNGIMYAAPPYEAFFIALVGTHIFVRSGLTYDAVAWSQIIIMGFVFGLALALYATYYQDENDPTVARTGRDSIIAFGKRLTLAAFLGLGPVFGGLVFWTSVLYPVALIHLVASIGFSMHFISSTSFNQKL